MANSTKIKDLLDKSKHYDADERFMSVMDLIAELKLISGQLDASLQLPIRDVILKLLDDGSSDVATVAVKCLSQIVQKFSSDHICYIVEKLATLITQPPGINEFAQNSHIYRIMFYHQALPMLDSNFYNVINYCVSLILQAFNRR
jgi:hypothetical protein